MVRMGCPIHRPHACLDISDSHFNKSYSKADFFALAIVYVNYLLLICSADRIAEARSRAMRVGRQT